MAIKTKKKSEILTAQSPLILRCQRLMEAFAKSDDERDFYLDRTEGFIIYVDLDRPTEELEALYAEVEANLDRYCLIPKLTFFETKKIMEGFVNEKVYDIDTKEKLLDIIQSKEARDHFLEFLFDHHTELDKWQQFYQERSRIRIIEWLRKNDFYFVFEEDLDLTKNTLENVKKTLFDKEAPRDVMTARKALVTKAKTYYSSEALNPRPKRGRPPKQTAKLEIEPQVSVDIYTQVPGVVRPFLFIPEISSITGATFSSKFESEGDLLANRRLQMVDVDRDLTLENLNKKLASLREISNKFVEKGDATSVNGTAPLKDTDLTLFEDFGDDDEDDDFSFDEDLDKPSKAAAKASVGKAKSTPPSKKTAPAPLKKVKSPPPTPKKSVQPPKSPLKSALKAPVKPVAKPQIKPAAKPPLKPAPKPSVKPSVKPTTKPALKSIPKPKPKPTPVKKIAPKPIAKPKSKTPPPKKR